MAAILDKLTDEELKITLPALIKLLKTNTSDSKFLTAEKIIGWFKKHQERLGYKAAFNKTRLMKLTNYIRMNNLLSLYSGAEGYCVTIDPERIQKTIDEFCGRINSHIAMLNALKKTKADLELQIQIKAFEKAKMKRDTYKPKEKKVKKDDQINDFNSLEDLFN